MPDVYLGPAWFVSVGVGSMALVRAGLWLKQNGRTNGRVNGRSKTGEAEAEFRGEVRQMLNRLTEIMIALADDMNELQKIHALQTAILERLAAKAEAQP